MKGRLAWGIWWETSYFNNTNILIYANYTNSIRIRLVFYG